MKRSLRSWLWNVPVEQEVDEELALHIEMRTRELVERGMDPRAAREVVLARIGDLGQLKRTCMDLGRKREREMRLTQFLEDLRNDVRFAIRQLRRAPGFTLVAALTLALGIGANSAIFALADATLLRPFPLPQPDRLLMVWERFQMFNRAAVAPLNLDDWSERTRTFQSMAGILVFPRGLVTADGTVEQVSGAQVTRAFFDVLGVKPIAGRTFLPTDSTTPPNTVVLSEGLWRTRFGSDPTLIGRAIRLDDQAFTVLGVVPEQAQVIQQANLWTTLAELPGMDRRGLHFLRVIGRLKPGVTMAAAQSDLSSIAAALAEEHPATNKGRGVSVEPLRSGLIGGEVRLTAMLLVAVVGFVLLMCCANVANLLLARMNGRSRELAIRGALGAGRRRITAQILTESIVLAALGGALGLGIGWAILTTAPSVIPAGLLPSAVTLSFDARVAGFCAAAASLVGLLFGLAPAWHASGMSLVQAITSDSRSTTKGGGRLQSLLVAGEIAAAVLLLCGAGLLLRTLMAVENVDAGYGADNVLTMRASLTYGLPTGPFPNEDSLRRFFSAVEAEVQTVPGVRSVAWTSGLPLTGVSLGGFAFQIVGDEAPPATNRPMVDQQIVSPAYLQTLDIPIVAGRGFDDRDTKDGVQVCLVSEAFVRRYMRGRNPLGMRVAVRPMRLGPEPPIVREIVGVVGQVRSLPTESDDTNQLYVPVAQNAWSFATLVVRPQSGPAAALAPAVRAAVARIDRTVPITNIRTMDQVAWEATGRQRFRAVMVMAFAALALMLAMVGVFGVLAYSVQQRTREFGVRIALGASAGSVLGIVLRNAVRLIGAGAVVGLILAALLAQSIATFLFGVRPLDPLTFGAVVIVLGLTAAFASAVPAIRATRVDPVVAFRND
jgi:putative ABC transport system permease protein